MYNPQSKFDVLFGQCLVQYFVYTSNQYDVVWFYVIMFYHVLSFFPLLNVIKKAWNMKNLNVIFLTYDLGMWSYLTQIDVFALLLLK